MSAILRNEARKLLRGPLALIGLFALTAVFTFAAFPGFADQAGVVEEAYPEVLLGLFGFEEMHTIEGFVAGYLYTFLWVLLGGIYIAYVSAGLIAGDIRDRRMDLTLSNPVSRESVILQKVGALAVPLVLLNVGLVAIVVAGTVALDEAIPPVSLAMVHLLSLPYLLVCAGIGIVFSVTVDREETAQIAALGLVFVLWLVEGISAMDPEFEWIGEIAPNRYFDPTAILVYEEYALIDAGVLLLAFVGLLGSAVVIFVRRDI